MRVGILTYPNTNSLGASLQMYALYRVVSKLGHEAEVINYDPPNLHNRRSNMSKTQERSLITCVKQRMIQCLVPQAQPKFDRFEGQLTKVPPIATSESAVLRELAERYDRIVVGSDQVWNEQITGHDYNFYLEFCADDSKKVSYAASFGNDDVLEEERHYIAELLGKFRCISVREVQGQQIVEKLIGVKPNLVLDPTLLIDSSELKKQIVPYPITKKYVLFYNIKPSMRLRKIAQEFADKNGYVLVFLNGRVKDRFDKRKYPAYGIGPREFLGLVHGAEYVFTNSFHGVAISVALNKNFYVEYSTDTNSRLTNLIEMLELEKCVVSDSIVYNEPVLIDYALVEEKLAIMKKQSLEYLRGALGE